MQQPATISLGQVAHTRSGDKGNHANLGVVAYTLAGYEFLCRELTAERVAAHFAGLAASPGSPLRVERFELPGIGALNFMLYDCLDGGASRSLRIDTQGKLLGTAALEISLPRPANLTEMVRPREQPSQAPSSQAASAVLAISLPPETRERMRKLAEKARQGKLTSAEREELEACERAASLLETLQSKKAGGDSNDAAPGR